MRVLPCVLSLMACAGAPKVPVRIDSFTASTTQLILGDSATLSWKAEGIASCLLDQASVPAEGTQTVTPQLSTTYTLSCGELSQTVHLGVSARAHIDTFAASPAASVPDALVTLSWTSRGTTACSLSPGDQVVPISGSLTVSPGTTTTYTLTCAGAFGPARASATVTVSPITARSAPTNLTLTPGDGTLTLRWDQEPGAADVYFAAEPGFDAGTVRSLKEGLVVERVHPPFVVSGLTNGTTYYARVSAVSGAVQSPLSEQASGVPAAGAAGIDPLYPQQWHLGTIDAEGAWSEGARGEGVRVAVVDEGVDLAHEDLFQNVATGRSFDYLGDAPLALAQHGTCVAGLVAARDLNGVGVRGVAPRSSIVSYNLLQDLSSENEFDAMTRGEAEVSVSNNSWGDDDGTGLLTQSDPLWLAGVQEGTAHGRQGLGVLYFWAGGNGGESQYRDLSNYDGQANRRYVFAIGGVGADGTVAGYSEQGANILVGAPTQGNTGLALVTTDLTGTDGYNTGTTFGELGNANYTQTMNGTSGATPIAAGVGALILQVRPELSWRDVRRVLAYSAKKIDDADPDWALNGAGLHVNHKYGFGQLDAHAAVDVARTLVPGGPEVIASTPKLALNLPIPDGDDAGVSNTVTVAGSGISRLEFVEIIVSLAHPQSGELEVTLQKVGGARDVLHQPHRCKPDPVTNQAVCSTLDEYPFGSTRHLDEPADGDWVLTVRDLSSGNSGQLLDWHLTLYGR